MLQHIKQINTNAQRSERAATYETGETTHTLPSLNGVQNIKSGWWYTYPSEKYEFVSWDDESPNIMESHKIHVPNHQSQIVSITYYCYYSYKPTWLMHCK
jgi:hypothetical protein